MATFLARANLTIDGQSITYGEVVDLEPTDEVQACVRVAFLVAQNADGTFTDLGSPAFADSPRRCCGG